MNNILAESIGLSTFFTIYFLHHSLTTEKTHYKILTGLNLGVLISCTLHLLRITQT